MHTLPCGSMRKVTLRQSSGAPHKSHHTSNLIPRAHPEVSAAKVLKADILANFSNRYEPAKPQLVYCKADVGADASADVDQVVDLKGVYTNYRIPARMPIRLGVRF